MDDFKDALGTSADVTVFRKLAGLQYRTATRTGGGTTPWTSSPASTSPGCGRSAKCGSAALGSRWADRGSPGRAADAGYDAAELEAVLNVEAKAALLKLVRSGRLAREQVAGRYVYLSPQSAERRAQLAAGAVTTPRPAAFPSAPGCGCCLTS